ncbi:amidohydrolase [Vitiosangium sp. GDMCC 1.1324]|uniref:amidohydrolase n=1 Tax=Vitiosangium sp. (strain GDMCC 1.1324) TaxID=2138576 RepID=UPI000D33EC2B|nr:amidohydrolase [Vitiosangium sp. GDMCC 1.1324]PTL81526.1 amidohydrolase [Vitiosangium sp. GDMCC 1.1324]
MPGRSFQYIHLLLGAVALALGVGCARRAPEGARVETTVYVARRIRTLDEKRPEAEALAVRHGRLLAVGTKAEVLKAAGEGARVVDFGNAVMVPGLVDAHAHIAGLGRSLTVARLEGSRSVDEAVRRLSDAPSTSFQGDWLIGKGWDQNGWPGKEFPGRAELDARFPRTPVYLTRVDHHAAWVNGEALKRAGIGRETPDPAGGRILRDAKGEPTGVLVDNAMDLVARVVPPPTDEQLEARLAAALERCAQVGLTGVHDAGMDLRTFRKLQTWDMAGRLPVRVYAMADGQGEERRTYLDLGTYSGRMLEMKAVKFLLDGALGSRGAALHEPYSDAPGETGLLLMEPEELAARTWAFMERGFQVCVHAIGDRANTLVVDTLIRAAAATGTKPLRHRVEHAQILRPEDIRKLGEAGLVASVQPTHATSDMGWAEARLGAERLKGAYAWKSLKEAGAVLALGSDFPIENPDVLAGLYAARTRQDAAGKPEGGWQPQERLTGQEALEGFTVGPAWASFAEGRRGRLVEGMDADFTVLSVDPVSDEAKRLVDAKVVATVVDGREVYRLPEQP